MNVAEIDVKDGPGESLLFRAEPAKWTIESTSVHTNDGGGINALIAGNFQTHFLLRMVIKTFRARLTSFL